MESKVRDAIFRQVEQEPFALKFGLKVDSNIRIQGVEGSKIPVRCLGQRDA